MTVTSNIQRLKYAVEGCINGIWGDEPNGADDVVVVRVADFDRERCCVELGDSPTIRAVPESARSRRLLRSGDLLLEKSGGGEQQPVGNVVLFDRNVAAVCSNFVARMPVAAGCDSRYLAYVFRALYNEGRNIPHVKQTSGIQNLDSESYLNERAWLPTKATQERIANLLDEQTMRIDALIAEKEALLQLLPELQSQAVDAAVLGNDLAGDGRTLKGVEQLGRIPSDWASSRLKYELEYVTSGSRGWADYYANDGALFVRIGNLTRNSVDLDLSDIQRVALPDAAEGMRARVKAGDLLISITAYLGSVAVAPPDLEEAYVSQHVALARPSGRRAHPRWLGYVLLSSVGRTFFDLQAYGGTKVQLSLDDIREVPIPLPSLEDQSTRIKKLELRLQQLRDTGSHVERHIGRLREYRSSLISAAVTGQLDLGASAPTEKELETAA